MIRCHVTPLKSSPVACIGIRRESIQIRAPLPRIVLSLSISSIGPLCKQEFLSTLNLQLHQLCRTIIKLMDHRYSSIIVALPTIHRKMTLSNRRTHFVRPSYIITYPEPISSQHRAKQIDVWEHLAHALRRPILRDPPSTPDEPLPSRQLDEPLTGMHSTAEKNDKKRTLRRPLRYSDRNPEN